MLNNETTTNIDWTWWKLVVVFLGGFGIFGVLLGLLPNFSLEALIIGILFNVLITGMGLWSWKSSNLTPKVLLLILFTFQLLGVGIRFWITIYKGFLPWFPILALGYLLAWFIPIIMPELSEFLWTEQTAPKTKVGKILLSVFLSLAPIAGVLGASGGMYSSRSGSNRLTDIGIASLFSMVAIGLSFIFAHQFMTHYRESSSETSEE
ncbi:MAG: hypothetical protein KGY69_19795 [Bacteroidales bacterium]|nr:hypothetical protein [Bacteroidales bacterium]